MAGKAPPSTRDEQHHNSCTSSASSQISSSTADVVPTTPNINSGVNGVLINHYHCNNNKDENTVLAAATMKDVAAVIPSTAATNGFVIGAAALSLPEVGCRSAEDENGVATTSTMTAAANPSVTTTTRQTKSLSTPTSSMENGVSAKLLNNNSFPTIELDHYHCNGHHNHSHQHHLLNGGSLFLDTQRQLSRQDASIVSTTTRKSPLGRTDELLLEYDDESDGEFEGELFSTTATTTSSASISATASVPPQAAATASASYASNHSLLLTASTSTPPPQRQYSVHGATASSNMSNATTIQRGVTCDKVAVIPTLSSTMSADERRQRAFGSSAAAASGRLSPLRRGGIGSTTRQINPLLKSSHSGEQRAASAAIDAPSSSAFVSVTLNGTGIGGCSSGGGGRLVRGGSNSTSFNALATTAASEDQPCSTKATLAPLSADQRWRSLNNLDTSVSSSALKATSAPLSPLNAVSHHYRVCISPSSSSASSSCVSVPPHGGPHHWKFASAARRQNLNRQNLRLPVTGPVPLSTTDAIYNSRSPSQASDAFAGQQPEPPQQQQTRIFPRQQHIIADCAASGSGHNGGDIRLQQSLSTPCPGGGTKIDCCDGSAGGSGSDGSGAGADGLAALNSGVGARKDTGEYRRFKSEGSTTTGPGGRSSAGITAAGGVGVSGDGGANTADMDIIALDDLSPVGDGPHHHHHHHHHRSSPPHRLNIFQMQDTVVGSNGGVGSGVPLAKHSHTEQVMMMHTLKTKLQKYQSFIDKAFQLIQQNSDDQIFEGCTIVTKVMTKAWSFKKISHDLAYALCDYLRDQDYFELLLNLFIKPGTCDSVRLCCGRVLEECMSLNNRNFVVTKNYLKRVVATAEKLNKNQEQQRISLSIMESLFKHSTETTSRLIEFGVLDHILLTCKRATESPITLRHAALALANLALYSTSEARKKIIQKKLPDWLFLLASQQDEITRYYACLAICMLASSSSSSKELEAAVTKSGTLALVEPFLVAHRPVQFGNHDYKHSQGRPKEWLIRLLPMLRSKCREAKSMAAFHFTMEADIKKGQQKLEVLQEIGAIECLKEVASSPDELAAKFASEALTIIGEEVPYKLSQQVPCWSISDVQYWVEKIGFVAFADHFVKNMVDGDLLLLLTERELEEDLGMKSGLLRKRFMRELESLKIAADYSSVDESQLDQFLMSLSAELSVYTYQMLGMGLNRNLLPHLTNDMMKTVCGIQNPIHRLKLRQALQDSKHIDDIEVAILSKQIDVFISYRRSTGNQLASLIKVLLQLRGYKVFIDVDKLYAGKFDSHLLKNIQAAKHFILVLTPHSLDRLLNDSNCEDWIHKELRCAFEYQKNVIPIFDQQFEFPAVETELPDDIRQITKFNGVRWVHDYQEACVDKVERFIKGELNRVPSLGGNQLSVRPSNQPTSRKAAYKLTTTAAAAASASSVATRHPIHHGGSGSGNSLTATSSAALNRNRFSQQQQHSQHSHQPPAQLLQNQQQQQANNTAGNNSNNNNMSIRSSSMEKQRRKMFSSSVSTVYSEK